MPLMQYKATALALQIEGFPEEAKRSCEGSLHLRPGATLDLTADEHDFIKAKRPEVFASLRCMMTDEERAAASAPPSEAKPADEDEGAPEGAPEAPRSPKPKR
jgi:hypothetical protein